MENESGAKEKTSFERKLESAQNVAEIVVLVCWLAAVALLLLLGSTLCQRIFEIASISLLGVSVFNIITMIGLSAAKQVRFSTSRLFMRILLGALAMIGLAVNLFAAGIRIQ